MTANGIKAAFHYDKTNFYIFSLICLGLGLFYYFFSAHLFSLSLVLRRELSDQLTPFAFNFFHIITVFGTWRFTTFIIVILFNTANIYKTLCFTFAITINDFLFGTLKILIRAPRPFWIDPLLFTSTCEGGWGAPSGHACHTVATSLTLLYIVLNSSEVSKNTIAKVGVSILVGTFMGVIIFSRFALSVHSLDQLILGSLIGFLSVFFFKFVLTVDLNSPNQLLAILRQSSLKITLFFAVFLLLDFFIYWNLPVVDSTEYDNVLLQLCPHMYRNSKFDEEGLSNTAGFFGSSFFLFALKWQYEKVFDSNNMAFTCFHFDQKGEHNRQAFGISEVNSTQWNHTSFTKVGVRIFITLLALGLLALPFYLMKEDLNFYVLYFIKRIALVAIGMAALGLGLNLLFMEIGLVNKNAMNLFETEGNNKGE